MTRVTESEAETASLGRRLAEDLQSGDVVLLYGDLGAGKTAFVRGLAEGLGIDPQEVSSPTFTIVQQYSGGRVPLLHVDLYRIAPEEVDALGLAELGESSITAIEWAERLPRVPRAGIRVDLQHAGESRRSISMAPGRSLDDR